MSVSAPEKNDCFQQTTQFLITWTPRIIVAAFAGYYSLGVAYDVGLMAAIDKIAIAILKDSVGYAGIGAAMPTFQWYSAWAVRSVAAAGAGLIYDMLEKLTVLIHHQFQGSCSTLETRTSEVIV